MSHRVLGDKHVYDKVEVDSDTGEMSVWDTSIFPSVVRSRQYAFFRRVLDLAPKGARLDVGCGGGWTTHFFSQDGTMTVGIDVSKSLLRKAIKARNPCEEFIVADAGRVPLRDESISLLVSVSALHHLPVEVALREWMRVLKSGGMLVLLEPNILNPVGTLGRTMFPTETHTEGERPFSPDNLRSFLAASGLEILSWETQILLAFAVSRVVRLLHLPKKSSEGLARLVERIEQAASEFTARKNLGWVILCLARKGD